MTNKIEEILRLCQENDVKLIDYETHDQIRNIPVAV